MGTGNAIKIQAKSLEQALVKAAGSLGISQEHIDYKVVKDDTAKSLLSFFKKPRIEISAWKREGQSSRSKRPTAARGRGARGSSYETYNEGDELKANRPPLDQTTIDALVDELRQFCAGICGYISDKEVVVNVEVEESRLVLDIEDEYLAQQIAKNSKLAEALEHILRKKPRHLKQELPFRIFVDVSGERRKREEDLIQMAFDLSEKVHENRRPIVLNYKSSYDRKIIHMALDKDQRVYTKSIGNGPNRKLMILPVRDQDGEAYGGAN
jgi:spoIIIJ-associated protein